MTQLDRHYVDPRLVELYDTENPRGADTDFYLRLASGLGARRIVDLGCGTGTLTCELAVYDRDLVGIDPSPMMLAVARRKPGAERVQWVEGSSRAIGTPAADLALMTGNVAQIFLDDVEWSATLRDIHAGLRPGAYLAFESRNPEAKAWESWHREATYAQLDSPYGPVQTWLELEDVRGGRVRFVGYNAFTRTKEVVEAPSELRFRTLAELTDCLSEAGFVVEHAYGDWKCGPLLQTSQVIVIVAQARRRCS